MEMQPPTTRTIADLVFVGFNAQVVALDRYSGHVVWSWTAPSGSGFAAILVDGDRLIVSVNGYTYCLDPVFGQEVWAQPLKGFGVGTPCVASIRGSSPEPAAMAAAKVIADQQAAAAAAAAT